MTARPSLVCPRCGSSDIHVAQVDGDGNVRVRCSDPQCNHPWEVPAPSPSVVPQLRELGARLAGQRRAVARANQPRRRHERAESVNRARVAAMWEADRLQADIRDLLEQGVAA